MAFRTESDVLASLRIQFSTVGMYCIAENLDPLAELHVTEEIFRAHCTHEHTIFDIQKYGQFLILKNCLKGFLNLNRPSWPLTFCHYSPKNIFCIMLHEYFFRLVEASRVGDHMHTKAQKTSSQ